jgi:hypothetical protein
MKLRASLTRNCPSGLLMSAAILASTKLVPIPSTRHKADPV